MPQLSAGALAVLCRIVDFQSLDSIPADEPAVKELHRKIANLVERDELFLERLDVDRAAVNNPVVAEITEYDGHFSSFFGRHIIGDHHTLAEDGIVRLIPQRIACLIFHKAQRERGMIIHQPYGILAVLLVQREKQTNDIIISNGIAINTGFCAISRAENTLQILEKLENYNLSDTQDDVKGIAFEQFLGTTFRGELGQFLRRERLSIL